MTQSSNSDYESYAKEVFAAEEAGRNAAPQALDALGAVLVGEFQQAVLARRETEVRWLKDLRQYRGQYDPEVLALIGPKRSKAFVRKTRVKVKTTDSRLADLLFPVGSDKNWDVEPTPKPSLSPDQRVEIRAILQKQAQGQPITREIFEQAVAEWAKARAKGMSKTVEDQLAEVSYKRSCLKAIHSGDLYGTGIIKGPLVERKVRTRFVNQGGKWIPQSESYIVPFVEYVPLWRFYPDMGSTELEKCRFTYERHYMTKNDMAGLAARRSFNKKRIVDHMIANPEGSAMLDTTDNELRQIGDRAASANSTAGMYEVLERWGWLDGQQLRDAGVEVEQDRVHEAFFSNVWLLPNGQIIKAVLQPINGVTWPYHLYQFDKDETSIFSEGLAAIMRDDQTMICAATRLLIDNAAIASAAMIERANGLLNGSTTTEVGPWAVFDRNNTNPGVPAIRVVELPSRMAELSSMVSMFDANADEVSAIPRYVGGENSTNGAAGTSSGLSMLMGNVNIVLKELVTSWDEGITCPFIKGMVNWNMQFNPDDSIKGDFDTSARGSASLVAKEVRARALNEFAATTANPLDAPYIKRDVLNRQRAEVNELTDCVKTEDEVTAEQSSPAAQAQQQMAQMAQQLALQEAQAKVNKLLADAELAKTGAQQMLANIELIVAKAVATKVEAAYAALQAGGVATSTPQIAPAGDEILRSSGWVDKTPEPPISSLDGPPVQKDQGTSRVLNKGQSFAVEPRGNTTEYAPGVDPAQAIEQARPDPQPQTGMVGRRSGIETTRID